MFKINKKTEKKEKKEKQYSVLKTLKEISRINRRALKNGSYSLVSTVIVFAVILVINLIVAQIPEAYTQIDLSEQKLYTVSDTTIDFLDELEEDVTIYYIVQSGNEDTILEKMLTRYDEASDHVSVVKKDPMLYPNFTSQFTEDDVDENSLIVVHEDRSKVVAYDDLYETSYNYYSYSTSTTAFDGEGQIDSAISYVISDDLPILYTLSGHGETELNSSLTESLEKANYQIEELNLLTEESVPEDTGCLMILSPTSDISSDEADKIITYLEGGGKAFIITTYTTESMDNLNSVLENYGVTCKDGVVFEGDTRHYIMQTPYYIVPDIESTDFTSDLISDGRYILMPIAQAVEELDSYRDSLVIDPILQTSEEAYIKTDVQNMTTYEKEDEDEEGQFMLGVSISESIDSDHTTQIIYFTSYYLIDESMDQTVSGGNTELVLASLGSICENDVPVIEAASKSLEIEYLTVPEYDAGYWAAMVCGVIPAAFLVVGVIIWFKRRKQ